MRKLVVTIVALLYLAAASGATMHLHYCMGKLVDAKAFHKPAKTCGKCGMEKKPGKDNGCCKDEHKFVLLDKDQKATAQQLFTFKAFSAVAVIPHYFNTELLPAALAEYFPISHAPPLPGSTAIYLQHCVFRI